MAAVPEGQAPSQHVMLCCGVASQSVAKLGACTRLTSSIRKLILQSQAGSSSSRCSVAALLVACWQCMYRVLLQLLFKRQGASSTGPAHAILLQRRPFVDSSRQPWLWLLRPRNCTHLSRRCFSTVL